MKEISYKKLAVIMISVMLTVTAATIIGVVIYGNRVYRILEEGEKESDIQKHYAFICENRNDGFYRSI